MLDSNFALLAASTLEPIGILTVLEYLLQSWAWFYLLPVDMYQLLSIASSCIEIALLSS